MLVLTKDQKFRTKMLAPIRALPRLAARGVLFVVSPEREDYSMSPVFGGRGNCHPHFMYVDCKGLDSSRWKFLGKAILTSINLVRTAPKEYIRRLKFL